MKHRHINNEGFSLVEIIVVIAIMAIAIGTVALSVSMVTGAESRKAFKKIESLIDEARTGAMSRFGQELQIKYLAKDTTYDGTDVTGSVDSNGFYGIMKLTTIQAKPDASNPGHPTVMNKEISGSEQRKLCSDDVVIAVECEASGGTTEHYIGADADSYISFSFDRATGLYSKIIIKDIGGGETTINYNKITRTFNDGTNDVNVYITAKSGMRTHKMQLIGETGKHVEVE